VIVRESDVSVVVRRRLDAVTVCNGEQRHGINADEMFCVLVFLPPSPSELEARRGSRAPIGIPVSDTQPMRRNAQTCSRPVQRRRAIGGNVATDRWHSCCLSQLAWDGLHTTSRKEKHVSVRGRLARPHVPDHVGIKEMFIMGVPF
jgi:hypothetical protein